ncbi:MAG: AAA family ATPase [Actinomycetota bacterium]|nr:AAA family ATPase [Actinomycetota bacterium]
MGIYAKINSEINKNNNSFNIIVADRDVATFKKFQKLSDRFNFINLSSYFAVSFILEYEKIDLIIISRKISNLPEIIEKAARKKISVCILGKDISLPINEDEVESIILKEADRKYESRKNRRFGLKKYVIGLLKPDVSRRVNLQQELENSKKNKGIKNDTKTKVETEDKNKAVRSKELEKEVGKEVSKDASQNFVNNLSNKNSFGYEEKNDEEKNEYKDVIKYTGGTRSDSKKGYVQFNSDRDLMLENDLKNMSIKTIKQKVIVLSRAKGGVGSTTISIFLAFMLKKINTLLVDLNFSEGGGDISYYLGIPKSPNILNFVDGYNRESLKNSVIKIRENLDVLQAPPTYEMSTNIDLQDIYCLADVARKKYHLIIFDLPNKFDDSLLGIIDLADLLIMVSDDTPGSIGRLIEINNRFFYDDMEKLLIINKYSRANGSGLLKNHIGDFFNLKDFVFIDESETLRGKTEFLNFNFTNIKSFNNLAERIFNLLTCD